MPRDIGIKILGKWIVMLTSSFVGTSILKDEMLCGRSVKSVEMCTLSF